MTALVTGGTRGIGLAVSRELATRGHPVAMVYVADHAAANAAVASVPGSKAVCADLADADAVERAWADAAELGDVDVVVHAAVQPLFTNALRSTLDQHDTEYAIGPRAFLVLGQLASRSMAAGGSLVAVSSLGAERVGPRYAAIGPAKAALEAMVRYLAVELARKGIRVNCVSTATVDSKYLASLPNADDVRDALVARTPAARLADEADVARVVAMLCGPDAAWIVGQTIVADGGFSLPV